MITEIGAIQPCQIPIKNPALSASELELPPGMHDVTNNSKRIKRNIDIYFVFIFIPYSIVVLNFDALNCLPEFRPVITVLEHTLNFPVLINLKDYFIARLSIASNPLECIALHMFQLFQIIYWV